MSDGLVVGIDLGTTNSEVAAFKEGRVRVLGPGSPPMLASCVGVSPQGELLVGRAAKNQLLLCPERTIRSVKRKMGSTEKILLGDRAFAPEEVSSLILRELASWAEKALGQKVSRAVITVPAYFSDAQRNATREAGALAGLEVVRILNEPTAASLAYGSTGDRRTLMIYDLGGGTFDVSIVTCENDVTEVLASHGNNQLGGDDFDELLLTRLVAAFEERHKVDVRRGHPLALSRLLVAAEAAKRQLSAEPYATVREEALVAVDGAPLNLEVELSRQEYEKLIRPLLEGTLESVSRALLDAGKTPAQLDGILLVGGSTRTPLVSQLMIERTGLTPRQEVHPDLCVALGAGVLASRIAGHEVARVLVDVSPYSFGPSYLGERGGVPYPHCYHPIIHRNTALPVTRTERYCTAYAGQTKIELEIFQGDDPDALRNTLVGHFSVEGLAPVNEPNEVLVQMSLDVDGLLHVNATEKKTGLSRGIRINGALKPRSEAELEAARSRLEALYSERADELDEDEDEGEGGKAGEWTESASSVAIGPGAAPGDHVLTKAVEEARFLLERSRTILASMHEEDREEAIGLNEDLETAIGSNDGVALESAARELKELLFFVEGRK